MKHIINATINTILITIDILVAVAISTVGLTKKINEFQTRYNQGIQGVIVKDVVSVLNLSSGIVGKVPVQSGQAVKKGTLLITMTNPLLTDKLHAYQIFVNNESAQTEATITK